MDNYFYLLTIICINYYLLHYLKEKKVVILEDLAANFKIKTQVNIYDLKSFL